VIDILELKDRMTLLYGRAQLDGDNSELDALNRLAVSHSNNAASLSSCEETLPALPLISQLCTTSRWSTEEVQKNSVPTTSVLTSTEHMVKEEQVVSEQPTYAKWAKLLLIPGKSSVTKQLPDSGQSHTGVTQRDVHSVLGWQCEQGSGCSKEEKTMPNSGQKSMPLRYMNIKSASISSDRGSLVSLVPLSSAASEQGSGCSMEEKTMPNSGQKSMPSRDMNIKSTSMSSDRRSLVSLVPLSSAASAPSSRTCGPQVKSTWNQHVQIKLEPGMSCPSAGKRKRLADYGMF